MRILKFGGSSVATPERIKALPAILAAYQQEEYAVVFSAYGGVTDLLIEMARLAADGDAEYGVKLVQFIERHRHTALVLLGNAAFLEAEPELLESFQKLKDILHGVFLIRELSPRTLDYIQSFGEKLSAYTIAAFFQQEKIPAKYLDASKLIVTDDKYGSAAVDFATTHDRIQEYFKTVPGVHIITGFIGATKEGVTTTLGRGGSDYTASIMGAALEAVAIEIWTDVNGCLTTDPRRVPSAFTIPEMTYAEAMEMSHFGAKVIYAPTIVPAMLKNIPLWIKNTFNPEHPGTLVTSNVKQDHRHPIKGIAAVNGIGLITIEGGGMVGVTGIAQRLFGALAKRSINIILITQASSEHSITIAVNESEIDNALTAIEADFIYELNAQLIESPRCETGLCILAVIGENMRSSPGVAGKLFMALGKNGINISAIAQGSSELNISVVIRARDQTKALNVIHESFFLSDRKVLNLFLVGTGLIGKTLIRQLLEQADQVADKSKLILRVVGISNSRKMVFDVQGIDLLQYEECLRDRGQTADMRLFIDEMKALNLSNSIFIDNTADKTIPNYYEEILNSSISISASNKLGPSSSYAAYRKMKDAAWRRGVCFFFETNVGAGLPILNTLGDLINSGDQVLKMEAVVSGSLSFIFNQFKAGVLFSDLVKQAREIGYTEPDPREDLSGEDIARKLLIIARESGYPLERADIEIVPILPAFLMKEESIESFMKALPEADAQFSAQLKEVTERGEVLRCVAEWSPSGQAKISLKAIGASHPFYSLSSSDNMFVFTTERYHERPLIVRGPGAGPAVTAAGVFAEIIRIGKYLS